MTIQEALAILQGIAEGRAWQFTAGSIRGPWVDTCTEREDDPIDKISRGLTIRLKPEPEYVPLEPLDWIEGGPWWVRMERTVTHEKMPFLSAALVTGVLKDCILCGAVKEGSTHHSWSFKEAQTELERSRTGREDDWTSCRKMKPTN